MDTLSSSKDIEEDRGGGCQAGIGGGIGCLIIGGISLVLLYLILWAAGGFLIVADPLKKADVVVVLSGGNGERIKEAATLLDQKYATRLIITDTGETVGEFGPAREIMIGEAMSYGLLRGNILVTEKVVSSTLDEAKAVLFLEKSNDFKSCIIVTDPFHSRRTQIIFQEAFAGSNIQVRIHPVQGHWYRSNTWFFSRLGWETTIREYAKLFSYWAGIQID